jgi:hypothetical protein
MKKRKYLLLKLCIWLFSSINRFCCSHLEDQSNSELKERIKTDSNLIKEIILTEKDYVYDLSVIIEVSVY